MGGGVGGSVAYESRELEYTYSENCISLTRLNQTLFEQDKSSVFPGSNYVSDIYLFDGLCVA